MASTDMDGYEGNRVIDMFGNVFLGVQFNMRRDFSSPSETLTLEEVNYLNNRINENRFLIENQQTILERQQTLLEKLEKHPGERGIKDQQAVATTTPAAKDKVFPDYIYFELNSSEITISERAKIRKAVEYLNANPNSKLLLIGYADKLTGNDPYNMKLSRKRVETVADELRLQGINSNRFILDWKGDKEQPFTQNAWNRVVVMVER
jgi:outer membrane protein OmpA-like peptidoglycan-associated protein